MIREQYLSVLCDASPNFQILSDFLSHLEKVQTYKQLA